MSNSLPRGLALLFLTVLALALGACTETPTTQVVPVAQPLPQQEEARYRLLDGQGNDIGRAQFIIHTEGDYARLVLNYSFPPDRDNGERGDAAWVLVRRESMEPVRAERTVVDGDRRYVTRAEYDDKVTATLDDGRRTRRREAEIAESAYDNAEALFLWRTVDFSVGTEVSYVNVVIDPRRGTISRALGTVRVVGREAVSLPSGPVQAWRVQFRSAGVTNTAWYRADASRVLVRYEITRGPTLVLDAVTP